MKILFNALPTLSGYAGGGPIKLRKLKEYLGKKGIHVDLFNQWETRFEDYDICHHFSSLKWDLPLVQCAKFRGLKVVIETMYWSDLKYVLHMPMSSRKARLKEVTAYMIKWLFPKFPSTRRKTLMTADMLTPNSEAEAKQLMRLFGIPKNKIYIAHNGADKSFSEAKPDLFANRFGLENFILVVGRFEPRKNQLNLIRALRGLDIPVVFIGEIIPGILDWYYNLCRQEAGENMHFITDPFEHSDPLFASAYAAADTLAMPSWCETPGKVAIEAGFAGTKLLVTTRGCTREYFREFATYVDPDDIAGIRKAIIDTYKQSKDLKLRDYLLKHYTWEAVIDERIKAYEYLLQGKAPR